MIEKDGNSADDFVFTLIRYEKSFHVFINGHFVKTWENTVEDSGRTIDLTKIGTVVPGMLLRGNYGSTDVRFSEWEYTSDKTAVAEKLALGRIGGTVEGGNGTVTATLVENGVATNVKYSAKITNKAYSLSLTAGKTYNLYFDCGTTDGIIQGVTATKEGVTANLDKTYAKISVATPGGCGTAAARFMDEIGKQRIHSRRLASRRRVYDRAIRQKRKLYRKRKDQRRQRYASWIHNDYGRYGEKLADFQKRK